MLKMRRQREDIQTNVAGLRRNIKNIAHNYSEAQKKVREATSNDPWGPSSTLMSDIADMTYNVISFTEIMQIIWKRLNDHGKNWRHVYKALILIDYLIKTGSDKVASQCKENKYVIETLCNFQHFEENKDQGYNVREKAKALVLLLEDDERLRNERARLLKAKERFAQASSGFGSEGAPAEFSPLKDVLTSPTFNATFRDPRVTSTDFTSRELESARPQTAGEEELQLQLALAMSREEAEQEEQKKRSDDVRLQLALSQSENEFKHTPTGAGPSSSSIQSSSHMLDLLEVDTNSLGATGGAASALIDPWGMPTTNAPAIPPIPSLVSSTNNITRPQVDPWSCPAAIPSADPWAPANQGMSGLNNGLSNMPSISKPSDPWAPVASVSPTPIVASNDPWSLPPQQSPTDEFAEITNRNKSPVNGNISSSDPFDVTTITEDLKSTNLTNPSSQQVKKTPHSFLGENSALVNLDNLITVPPAVPALPIMQAQKTGGPLVNPFSSTSGAAAAAGFSSSVFHQSTPPNLFDNHHQTDRNNVSINQMRQQTTPFQTTLQQPITPQPNPFLS